MVLFLGLVERCRLSNGVGLAYCEFRLFTPVCVGCFGFIDLDSECVFEREREKGS